MRQFDSCKLGVIRYTYARTTEGVIVTTTASETVRICTKRGFRCRRYFFSSNKISRKDCYFELKDKEFGDANGSIDEKESGLITAVKEIMVEKNWHCLTLANKVMVVTFKKEKGDDTEDLAKEDLEAIVSAFDDIL